MSSYRNVCAQRALKVPCAIGGGGGRTWSLLIYSSVTYFLCGFVQGTCSPTLCLICKIGVLKVKWKVETECLKCKHWCIAGEIRSWVGGLDEFFWSPQGAHGGGFDLLCYFFPTIVSHLNFLLRCLFETEGLVSDPCGNDSHVLLIYYAKSFIRITGIFFNKELCM